MLFGVKQQMAAHNGRPGLKKKFATMSRNSAENRHF
jgi:hypothetical protein